MNYEYFAVDGGGGNDLSLAKLFLYWYHIIDKYANYNTIITLSKDRGIGVGVNDLNFAR